MLLQPKENRVVIYASVGSQVLGASRLEVSEHLRWTAESREDSSQRNVYKQAASNLATTAVSSRPTRSGVVQ